MTLSQHPNNKFPSNAREYRQKLTLEVNHHINQLKNGHRPLQILHLCRRQPINNLFTHTHSPSCKDCTNHFCWTSGLMFRKETTLKRHNTTVRHLLEEKRIKTVTENLQQTTTIWSTTNPELRYLSYIDHIDQECCAPVPTHKPFISSTYKLKESPIIMPLEKKGEVHDPRPGHGIYSNMKRPISSESPAAYAEEDIPDNPPFIIENNDKSLSYVTRPSS